MYTGVLVYSIHRITIVLSSLMFIPPLKCVKMRRNILVGLLLLMHLFKITVQYSIYVVGDFNADLSDGSSRLFANHLIYFCEDAYLILSSEVLLPREPHIYK